MSENLNKKPTRQFAKWITQLKYEDIPANVVEYVKLLSLDAFGIGMIGSTMSSGRMLANYAKDFGAPGKACVWGDGFHCDVVNASMANSTFMHSTELEDTHRFSFNHPSCVTVPAAMAFADQYGASGKELILALTAGAEVSCRIGVGTKMTTEATKRGWHAVGVLGAFGAAVTFGKLLGLNEEQMANALSLAGTQMTGAWAAGFAMAKRFHAGKACANGILAALLAKRGLTAGDEILEAKYGSFSNFMCDEADLDVMVRQLGVEWETTKVGIKPYPCKRFFHTAMENVLTLVQKHALVPEQIENLTVHFANIIPLKAYTPPKDMYEAQVSYAFMLAAAVFEGKPFVQLRPEIVESEAVKQFAAGITFVPDPEYAKDFSMAFKSRCIIKAKDGNQFEAETTYPLGEPEHPMTREQVIDKFRQGATYAIDRCRAEQLIARMFALENEANAGNLSSLLHF